MSKLGKGEEGPSGVHQDDRPLTHESVAHGCEAAHLGSRNSMTTLYSLVLGCSKRRFQPIMTPSKLPNTLSTSQGKTGWRSCTPTPQ